MSKVENRKSVVALWDVRGSNPNGDPNDENRPRIDLANGKCIVSPYRVKRTIRDYLDLQGQEIFIKEISAEDEKGKKSGKTRSSEFGKTPQEIQQNVLDRCIDSRLFGGFIPLESSGSIDFTGPIQVGWSHSLHTVQPTSYAGTTTLASKDGNSAGTFSENHVIEYGLFATLFTINENNAKHTNLTNQDVDLMLEAFWKGTTELNTSSKYNHNPRLLLEVEYSTPNFQIPDLDLGIKMVTKHGLAERDVRDSGDYVLDVTKLLDKLQKYSKHIKQVRYAVDTDVTYSHDFIREIKSYGISVSPLEYIPQNELVGV